VRSFSSLNALAPYYDSEQVRLFRNHPYYRFENAIHEMIIPSIVAQGGHLVKSHLVIHHYGYLKHVVQASESRIDRDRRLLEKMYFENPNSVYTKAKLAYIYLLEKKYPKALPLLLESVQELDAKTVDADFIHTVFVALAQTAQAVGDFKLSMECAKAGWVLNTQPSLTRSSMFYYATSNVALMLDQIEQWARDEGQSLSKSILQEQIAAFKTGLHESKAILDELQSAADMTSQAKANLAIWQEKMERVGKMLEGLAGMMEGE
jgi:tetratricopeptide (TPR) repeat protein